MGAALQHQKLDESEMSKVLSVVMPVYNAEKYLSQAIESVLHQELRDFELICIDDGSTDASSAILKSFEDRDSRVRVIRRDREGLVSALNAGLESATAPIVARMDADDVCLPGRLAQQFEYLARCPDVWVVGTARKLIDDRGRVLHAPAVVYGKDAVSEALLRSCELCHPTVMMRRQPILELGGYREAFRHAEDYDLWLRVVQHAKVDNLPFVGILHRIHDASVSEKYKISQRVSAALAQACYELRVAGHSDPVSVYRVPPDLWNDRLLDNLIPEHIEFFRSTLILLDPAASFDAKFLAAKKIENASPGIKKQNKKLYQEALLFAARHHRRMDLFKLRMFANAVRLHPGRFVRLSFAS